MKFKGKNYEIKSVKSPNGQFSVNYMVGTENKEDDWIKLYNKSDAGKKEQSLIDFIDSLLEEKNDAK